MWPFPKALDEPWKHLSAMPGDDQGSLAPQQRTFVFWSLDTSPHITKKEAAEVRRIYAGYVSVRNQRGADESLSYALSINRNHRSRVVDDDEYWEETQRSFHGQRLDRLQYLTMKNVPTGDKRPFRPAWQAKAPVIPVVWAAPAKP
ncbi:MAG: hypothetical protein WC876_06295 [Candidatus Thermoplasmatota archaeon]|jgi:hypothetical protein